MDTIWHSEITFKWLSALHHLCEVATTTHCLLLRKRFQISCLFPHGLPKNFSQVSSLLWWTHWSQTNQCKWSYALPALCAATCRLLPCGMNGIIQADPCPHLPGPTKEWQVAEYKLPHIRETSMTATCIISDISRHYVIANGYAWKCLTQPRHSRLARGVRGGMGAFEISNHPVSTFKTMNL